VIAFFAFALAVLARHGHGMPLSSALFFFELVLQCIFIWICALAAFDVLQLWRAGAPAGLGGILLERMSLRLLTGDRIGNSFHALLTLLPMMIAFMVIKENIATINPFSWDRTFEHWDRALGYGRLPWEILQPAFDHPAITVALNVCYHLWFFVMFGVLIWQAFSAWTSALRMQFLLAFALVWLLGGAVLATVFSSAGPCFYDKLFPGPSPFAEQMNYLHSIGPDWIWSLAVQDDLWHSYVTGTGDINGISAMPSLHVTVAVLIALFGWRVSPRLGIIFSGFAVAIFIGSVLLLWHYAVDGIAGAVIAWACWEVAGFATRRGQTDPVRQTASPSITSIDAG
jgi:membrane-associated phospholipid phosphatase